MIINTLYFILALALCSSTAVIPMDPDQQGHPNPYQTNPCPQPYGPAPHQQLPYYQTQYQQSYQIPCTNFTAQPEYIVAQSIYEAYRYNAYNAPSRITIVITEHPSHYDPSAPLRMRRREARKKLEKLAKERVKQNYPDMLPKRKKRARLTLQSTPAPILQPHSEQSTEPQQSISPEDFFSWDTFNDPSYQLFERDYTNPLNFE